MRERIAAERAERHRVALPIEARASALVRALIANGTTRARSHVDIDNDVGLANLEAVLKVREAFSEWIDIQLVAFPQSGVVTEKAAPDLLAAALKAGADLIGGLDPAGFDGDVKGQLDIVFGLAERFGKGVDIHLHDGGETGAAELRDIAERAIAAGMQGRVAVSHAFALGTIAPSLFEATAERLARAQVAIMTSCPPSAPVPPVKALRERGVDRFRGLRQHSRLLVAVRRRRHAAPRRDHRRAPRDVHGAASSSTPSHLQRAKRTRRSAIPAAACMPGRSPISSLWKPRASPTPSSNGRRDRWSCARGASRPSEAPVC